MIIYRHDFNATTFPDITLVQREHTPELWEMRDPDGNWLGAADYLPMLEQKLRRNWYHRIEERPEA